MFEAPLNPTTAADHVAVLASLAFDIAMPLLLTSLVIGIVMSVLQAITSIQEPGVTYFPKMLGVLAVLWLYGPFFFDKLASLYR
ncbi:MAG: flagellar biosynthetic protein FliQ [Geminicoccaceae bacterium]